MTAALLRPVEDRGALAAHWSLTLFDGDALREAGLHVGARTGPLVGLPGHIDAAKARRLGWRPGRGLWEPTGIELAILGLQPFEERDLGVNVMCNAGITRMLNLLSNIGATQAYDATHTGIGVGDGAGSVPTAASTDTDLAALTGATHRQIEPVDAMFPSVSGQVWTIQGTFGTGVGLFHWREFASSQDTAASTAALTAPVLDHKGQDMGDFTGTSISKVLKLQITES